LYVSRRGVYLATVEKLIIACLTVILILSTSFSQYSVFAQTKGPRTENLIIKFYPNTEEAYAALKNGSIDILAYELTSDLYEDAINDSNIVLGPVGDRGIYEFDINNNYTVSALFTGRRSPTSYVNFRRALAFLVDKTQIVDTFCGGFADRIDQPMAYQHRGWRNQSYWYEDGTYPYEFNPVQAATAFDAAGFVEGTDPNPDPNTGAPGYTPFLRVHPDTGVTMDMLEVYIRPDDLRRLEAGRALCDQLRILGIPVNQIENPGWWWDPDILFKTFHIYTGGWSLGRFPALTAHGLYHSSNYGPNNSNYVTGVDQNGDPNYPLLDELLEVAHFPDNYTEAVWAAKNAMGYITEQCITIPLFSARDYWAWSTNLLGVVNSDGVGPVNDYTFMNAYKVDGSPIRVGLKTLPNEMNKIYSSWYYDFQALDRMELYSGMDVAPYDQSVDQPGYILDWTTGTWDDGGESKTLVSQTYRDDVWFVEPVTGNQLEQVNVTHHKAAIWYDMQLPYCWNHGGVADVKTTRINTTTNTIDIMWNLTRYWNTYLGGTSIRSFNWYSQGNLSQTVTESLTADVISGFVSCTEPVFYVLNAESGGTPLVLGTDYDIYMDPDGPHNADVLVINPTYLGTPVNITYLATNDAFGYTPGNLPWQDAFEGAGMYYATDFTPGAGGYLMLKRNPFYPTETPLIGEIDFLKKSNGCYKVDIFDVVMAASAYGSQGVGVPDAHWFAGVDLAYPGGQIDIFDVVTVACKYGTEWDCYP